MTAVEWLIDHIVKDQMVESKSMREWIIIFEQAKEMEKQQLKEMYLKGIENYDPTFKKK